LKTINTRKYIAYSNAKINIGLRILSKRKDGYHNIETIFFPVKINDKIELLIKRESENTISNDIKLKTNKKALSKDNLCINAAKIFFEKFKINEKYKILIKLEKKIPIGAGLGGGSSNAAEILKILYKHFSGDENFLNDKRLFNAALILGSDVPFFLINKPVYATSRGEKMKILKNFRIRNKILIVNPNINISTKEAYNAINLIKPKKRVLQRIQKYVDIFQNDTVNDFEEYVFNKEPIIKGIKERMKELGAVFTQMSGSGSTVYGIFNNTDIIKAFNYFTKQKYKNKKFNVFIS
jgi:4-diphosphocytidyl-2-C-methyl-D-erythritol kinase